MPTNPQQLRTAIPAHGLRLARLALLLAVAALLVAALLPASADAGAARAKPTIVLVPPNPLRSLSGDAAYLSAFLLST